MNHSAEQIANSYRDPSLPTERRVTDLLSCMTLEEKLAQMGSVWVFQLLPGDDAFNELLSQGIGHVTRLAGASRPSSAMNSARRRMADFLIDILPFDKVENQICRSVRAPLHPLNGEGGRVAAFYT